MRGDLWMKKGNSIRIVFLIFLMFGVIFCRNGAEAAGQAKMEDGNIIFETVDTKATTNIRWMTAGFTIRKDRSYGNPLKNAKYAVIYLQPDFQSIKEYPKGTYHITYTIPKKKADLALLRAGLDEIRDGDTLYFNTIFKIKVYDVIQSRQYYRLNEIKNAAGWRNPDDFEEHFDIGVAFRSGKYPVTLEYRDISGKLLQKKKVGEWKAGKDVSVQLDGEKTAGGKNYILYQSYCIDLSKPSKKRNVITVSEEDYGKGHKQGKKLNINGMKIVARMKKRPEDPPEMPPPEDKTEEGTPAHPVENIKKELALDEIVCSAKIQAEKKGAELYDAEAAIPSGEKLYVEGKAEAALLEYQFTRYEGSIVYKVKVQADYRLRWKSVSDGKTVWKERTVNGDRTVYVKRAYSYWIIDYFHYYTADSMKIENEVLPGEAVVMTKAVKTPQLKYRKTDHTYPLVKEKTVNKGTFVQNVSDGSDSPYYIDYDQIAEQAVGEVRTRNDFVEFDGNCILTEEESVGSTKSPELPDLPQETAEFYMDNLEIAYDKKNEEYVSKGEVCYQKSASAVSGISSGEEENGADQIIYELEGMNPVTVFTPVVCHGSVTDQSYLCQNISPNPARCQLVIDTEFSISSSCYGTHLDYKGYGTGDYGKFTKGVEVSIPFDVYQGGVFYPAGTWQQVSGGSYYIPIWVKEGNYEISFRAAARNGNFGQPEMEEANLSPDYYIAASHVPVEVSGRLYGLKLYDITDYPLWKNVFRKENTQELSGTAYYVGTKNQNGADTGLKSIYTLPVLEGSHPFYQNTGYLKTGYVLRGSLKTVGSFYHEKDRVEIVPEFYFVDKQGENRKRVDLYYDESVAGKYRSLIRIGSERDAENIRILNLGSNGLSVGQQELKDTAFVENLDVEVVRDQQIQWHGYKELHLTSALRTFQGIYHMLGRNKAVPPGINEKEIMRAKQNWYFEYYLPSSYHITEYGYPVEEYGKNYPIDFQEDFWEKEGFLIVNFHIYADSEKERRLSYTNEENASLGYCNMWKTEGYVYHRRDGNGRTFHLKDGDFAVFSYGMGQAASSGEEYLAGGTH